MHIHPLIKIQQGSKYSSSDSVVDVSGGKKMYFFGYATQRKGRREGKFEATSHSQTGAIMRDHSVTDTGVPRIKCQGSFSLNSFKNGWSCLISVISTKNRASKLNRTLCISGMITKLSQGFCPHTQCTEIESTSGKLSTM